MSTKLVTRETIVQLLQNEKIKGDVVGRALVILLKRQTQEESAVNATKEENDVGFASNDARHGSISAKSYIKYGKLFDNQLEYWTKTMANGYPRIAKYHRQLNEAAVQKQRKAA